MTSGPFFVEELPKSGLFARILKKTPRAAAFVEVRNMLAITPWPAVSPAAVAAVLAKYNMLPTDAESELTDIFSTAARHVVEDGRASADERAGLARLREAFELTEAGSRAVFNDAARQLYREHLVTALADGEVTPAERENIDRIADGLELSADDSRRLYEQEGTRALQLFFNSVTADKRFSPDEEERLNQMAAALGITIQHDASTQQMLERFRLFGQIESGQLPVVEAGILLARGETCHFKTDNIAQKEIRTVTKRVNYSGVSSSIKIMKGVRYRVGSITPQRITHDVMLQIDAGALFLTSKRVLIQGTRKKTSIPLQKLIHFTIYNDGLQLQKETGKDVYLTGEADWELAGACLESAVALSRA